MDALATFNYIQSIQAAMQVMASLQLTSFLYPSSVEVRDGDTYDFIVVGAGTAGCVVASRLAEDNVTKVLLIEAGGDPPSESTLPSLMIYLAKSHSDWNYSIEDDGVTQRYHKEHLTDLMLGKMLGGSSNLNYMLYSQGSKHDYDSWSEMVADKSWNWEHISKYFRKSVRFENPANDDSNAQTYKGPLIVSTDQRSTVKEYLKAFKELGHNVVENLDAENNLGYSGQKYTIGKGNRQSTAFSHLRRVKDYPNMHVLKNSIVTKINFDNDKNAKSVEILVNNKDKITVKAQKEIIVSSGAINTPKLLLLSGVGPKDQLEPLGIQVISELPVGNNFQDQLGVVIIHDMTKMDKNPVPQSPHLYPAITFTGYVSLDNSGKPEYQTTNFVNAARYTMMYCTYTYGFVDEICNELFAQRGTNQILWTIITNLHPKSRGTLSLRSANALDTPMIKSGYFSDEGDIERHLKFVEDYMKVIGTSTFKKMGAAWVDPKVEACKNLEAGSDEYWKCYALSIMTSQRHYSGTCAMGSVVDSNLIVKGVQKLRIADASVFPTTISGDLMAAVVMVGEKAADLIKAANGIPVEEFS